MSLSVMAIATDDGIESKNLTDIKDSKVYYESTDDQSSSCGDDESTDEGSSASDGDTTALPSESPSRRGSAASITAADDISNSALLPSVGSIAHFTGECSRCCFFPKGRCNNGKDCTFCHFDHDRRPQRSKRGGSKSKAVQENGALASDPPLQAEPTIVAPVSETAAKTLAAPAPLMVKPPGLPTPKGFDSARFCPVPASIQPHETQTSVDLAQVAGKKPVKVWLKEAACSNKQLKASIPAKKRPPYPELISASRPTLDPTQPVKKRVPVFSEGFLEGLFTQPAPCITATAPAVCVPR